MADSARVGRPLAGKVALVTGANHGIGAATAERLAQLGADVTVTYLRITPHGRSQDFVAQRQRDGTKVAESIARAGSRSVTVEDDLTDPSAIPRLFDRAEAELGPVSVLVHAASGWHKDSFGPDGDLPSPASVDDQLHVDGRAGALLMSGFIERHRSRRSSWGRIVTLTSGDGRGYPGQASYGAGKASMISYTLTAASEMAADGVTANVVDPPVTDTGWVTDDVRAFVAESPDHHHVATPAEVADVVGWLCTDAARLVTGNVIHLR